MLRFKMEGARGDLYDVAAELVGNTVRSDGLRPGGNFMRQRDTSKSALGPWAIGLIGAGLFLLFLSWASAGLFALHKRAEQLGLVEPAFVAARVPNCGDAIVTQLVKDAIAESPMGAARRVKISDVADAKAMPGSSDEKRLCGALLYSNGGKLNAQFKIEWIGPAKDKIWLEFTDLQ